MVSGYLPSASLAHPRSAGVAAGQFELEVRAPARRFLRDDEPWGTCGTGDDPNPGPLWFEGCPSCLRMPGLRRSAADRNCRERLRPLRGAWPPPARAPGSSVAAQRRTQGKAVERRARPRLTAARGSATGQSESAVRRLGRRGTERPAAPFSVRGVSSRQRACLRDTERAADAMARPRPAPSAAPASERQRDRALPRS